jgi:hypothetical protein
VLKIDEDVAILNMLSDPESDCIVVATRVNKRMKLVGRFVHRIPEDTTFPAFLSAFFSPALPRTYLCMAIGVL